MCYVVLLKSLGFCLWPQSSKMQKPVSAQLLSDDSSSRQVRLPCLLYYTSISLVYSGSKVHELHVGAAKMLGDGPER